MTPLELIESIELRSDTVTGCFIGVKEWMRSVGASTPLYCRIVPETRINLDSNI